MTRQCCFSKPGEPHLVSCPQADREWAERFVSCQIKGTGQRFNETVEVLVKKLAEVRRDGRP
jgi:hypothetical protein